MEGFVSWTLLAGYFVGDVFPHISLTYSLYRWGFLHFWDLKCVWWAFIKIWLAVVSYSNLTAPCFVRRAGIIGQKYEMETAPGFLPSTVAQVAVPNLFSLSQYKLDPKQPFSHPFTFWWLSWTAGRFTKSQYFGNSVAPSGCFKVGTLTCFLKLFWWWCDDMWWWDEFVVGLCCCRCCCHSGIT